MQKQSLFFKLDQCNFLRKVLNFGNIFCIWIYPQKLILSTVLYYPSQTCWSCVHRNFSLEKLVLNSLSLLLPSLTASFTSFLSFTLSLWLSKKMERIVTDPLIISALYIFYWHIDSWCSLHNILFSYKTKPTSQQKKQNTRNPLCLWNLEKYFGWYNKQLIFSPKITSATEQNKLMFKGKLITDTLLLTAEQQPIYFN